MSRPVPAPGQESVWDYPRPPRLESSPDRLRVEINGINVGETSSGYRVLETSHPPVYYFPRSDVRLELLRESTRRSFCEWKGEAAYYHLQLPDRLITDIAWYYPQPTSAFAPIRGYLAFYPSKFDACWFNDEPVKAQEGDFYGGWITSHIVGPFKGPPGTGSW